MRAKEDEDMVKAKDIVSLTTFMSSDLTIKR